MQSPKIDNRTADDLAAETGALVSRLTGWRPPARVGDPGDAGQALIGLFGRYAAEVVDRLNVLPEKNFLAFLNLIGAEPLTPQPARVPLTFTLADGAPVDGVVPAGTQAAAPARQGDEDEVRFETTQELLVSRARIVAALVFDPWHDTMTDCLGSVEGTVDAPFALFGGAGPVGHELYVACDSLLADAAGRSVRIDLRSRSRWQWDTWPVRWSGWWGGAWHPLTTTAQMEAAPGNRWQVTVANLPPLEQTEVSGVSATWLRARLEQPMAPGRVRLAPAEAGPAPAERPGVTLPATPFAAGAQDWYLDGGVVFGQAGAVAEVEVQLATPGVATPDLRLDWQYLADGGVWKPLGPTVPPNPPIGFADSTAGLTRNGTVTFRLPADWSWQDQAERRGRWLRARRSAGSYPTPPVVGGLWFTWRWELPVVDQVQVTLGPVGGTPGATTASPPELGFTNTVAVDLGRDVSPFGPQPAYNDTFNLACEPALAQAGATVDVAVVLTNPAGGTNLPVTVVRTAGAPVVAWEMYTTAGWLALVTSPAVTATGNPASLTANGTVTLTVPATVATTTVGGESRHWLRARLVGGNYGEAATYTGTAAAGYTLNPATWSPPLIRSLRLTVTRPGTAAAGGTSQPATAVVTANGGVMADRTADLAPGPGAALAPTPVTPFAPLDGNQPALYLGLDQAFAPRPFTLFAQVEPPRPEEVAAEMLLAARNPDPPRVAWEYSTAAGWSPLGALDGTADLTRPGLVHFVGPDDQAPRLWLGHQLHWLAARWTGGTFLFAPRARQVRLNTTWASASTTSRDEVLGSSTGEANQRFTTVNAPVLVGEVLEVREGEAAVVGPPSAGGDPADDGADGRWVRWEAVGDLHASGPADRHYTVDRQAGTVIFGDGRQGMIPPLGQRNIRLSLYRWGGGAAGNRAAGEIVELKSSLPYIAGVTNHLPSAGGFDQEPLERVKERGPAALRHRDRAVTAQDLVDLAFAASPDVARVSVITPDFDAGQLWLGRGARPGAGHRAVPSGRAGLVIVPHGAEARPTPGLELLDQVRRYVADRYSPTAELWVAGPEWVAVSVETRVAPTSIEQADAVLGTVRRALDAFLHPLTGGPDGRGWAFGAVPRRSDLNRVLEATAGVDHVQTLAVTVEPVTARTDRDDLRAWLLRRATQTTTLNPDQRVWNSWAQRALIFAAEHTIRTVLDA